ncbi:MAG: cupin domain-containing protein [Erysipelotrichaceae bacterium]|nr:cupin domain-containing protein [Erysipelotrichaceae bacterium]
MIIKNIFRGRNYCWPTHTNSLLIDRKDTEGTEVFLTTIQPGKATPFHIHKDNEQLYYVISGRGLITSCLEGGKGDKKTKIKREDVVLIPIKTEHQASCIGNSPLVYLTIDVFPRGKPKDAPTWEAHAKELAVQTKAGLSRLNEF